MPVHVWSVAKKLAYKLSTSTRVAFDVMVTVAMSKALVNFFFWKIVLTRRRLKLYLSNTLGCQGYSKEFCQQSRCQGAHHRLKKEPKNGSCYYSFDPIHCQHEFDHNVCHLCSFSSFSSTDVYLLKMSFGHWARNGELFIPISMI